MPLDQTVDFVRETLLLTLWLSLPVLSAALVIGLVISLFQAVTQIQEQTLTFVPKILGMGVVAALVMPWMVKKILEFAKVAFSGLGA
ncbi:MAG: flagellar biosynthesis protein FliQ [Planctomycetota bacterium]